MRTRFFESPILNSPYEAPTRHWALDGGGQPTGEAAEGRRKASFVTPIPRAKKQTSLVLDEGQGLSALDPLLLPPGLQTALEATRGSVVVA